MSKWKASDVEKVTGKKVKPHSRSVKIPKSDPIGLQFIKNHLTLFEVDYVSELKFHDVRKFRFDVAILDLKIAIEYEGLNSKKSGHTTITGYTSDCTKYNLAQIDGWRVMRYTVINYKDFPKDLNQLLK